VFLQGKTARRLPAAQGWHLWVLWVLELNYPGSVKFYNDYKAIVGGEASATRIYYYNYFWTAIYAIELAGTDTDLVKIAEAARSGNLEWDTPIGHAHFRKADGTSDLGPSIVHIEGQKLVLVTFTE